MKRTRLTDFTLAAFSALSVSGCATQPATPPLDHHQIAADAARAAKADLTKYGECVLGSALAYAIDPKSKAVSAGDIADASIAKCVIELQRYRDDIQLELLAVAGALTGADEIAHQTQLQFRGYAVQDVIDTRAKLQ